MYELTVPVNECFHILTRSRWLVTDILQCRLEMTIQKMMAFSFLAECSLLLAGDVSNGLVWLGCGTRRTTMQRDIRKLTDAC